MITKRFLVFTPIGIAFFLFQSLFWAPTYDGQAQKNQNRLLQYIEGSIGDASILNPVLSADSASSYINSLIYDGLIDLDDKLNFRPILAKSWNEYEITYLFEPDNKVDLTADQRQIIGTKQIFVLDQFQSPPS